MTTAREVEAGVRWRALAGAIVLCLMFAAAGVAPRAVTVADVARAELGETRVSRNGRVPGAAAADDNAPLAKGSVVATAITAMPRVVARSRSIDAGGLPPPRAPTA